MKTPYWTKAIEEAHIRKAAGKPAFTQHQKDMAGEWVTCACGRLDKRIPKLTELGATAYMPRDHKLRWLGSTFSDAVRQDDPVYAGDVLAKIERRAGEILAQMEEI